MAEPGTSTAAGGSPPWASSPSCRRSPARRWARAPAIRARPGRAPGPRRSRPRSRRPPKPAELPLGGRTIFPHYRVVAYYGAPQNHELGALGIGSPDAAGRRLRQQAAPYARKTRPVMLAFELIATVANADPGEDGLYRTRQTDAVVRRYLRAARRAKALLVLDIQPGPRRLHGRGRATSTAGCASPTSASPSTRSGTRPAPQPGTVIGSVDGRRRSTPSPPTSRRSCARTTCPRSSSSCISSRRT